MNYAVMVVWLNGRQSYVCDGAYGDEPTTFRRKRDAEEVKKRILAESKIEAQAVAARAKKEIEMARDDAVKQLHDQTILLATSVAGKIVRKELSPGDHQELVDQALTEMGGLN